MIPKKTITILAVFFLLAPILYADLEIDALLKTQWGQRKTFAKFAPENYRLGCWSTAFAQILYFHRLKPEGTVSYTSSWGYKLKQDTGAFKFDFSQFIDKLTDQSPQQSVDQVARYIYFCALIIQKDFNTGSYMLKHKQRAEAVSRFYNCTTRYFSEKNYSGEEMLQIIIKELKAKQPLLLHLRNKDHSKYHAAVIDGLKIKDNTIHIHINMGHGGPDNGWYDFKGPILEYDDTAYRRLITIKAVSK